MKGYDNMDRVIEKVFINITNRCNNQCSYCFQDNSGSKICQLNCWKKYF